MLLFLRFFPLRIFLRNLFSSKFPLLRLNSLFDPLSFANRNINIRNYLILNQYRIMKTK